MLIGGLSDSIATVTDKPVKCACCGATARVAQGVCPNCLLQEALELDREASDEAFASVLNEIDLPDQQWRLGNYEILEEIGRGGMGVIYRARQRHSRRIVAVKRVLSYHADSQETMQRFRREAEAAASLDHPNILPIYEVGESDAGLPFFSMKFAAGGSLREAAPALRADPRRCVALLVRVARATDHAHRAGILHRDLKPGNILLDARGEPLVSDFGLAKWLESHSDLTRTLTIFGTPGYIAPEQAHRTVEQLTPAADVYSLGAILFDLLAGRPPFIGSHALSVIRQASENAAPKLRSLSKLADHDLEIICAKCLERDPRARYRSAGELAEDLARWLEGLPIVARRVLPPMRAWRWSRRNPALIVTAVVCLMFGAAAIVVVYPPWRHYAAESIVWPRQESAETKLLHEALLKYPELELDYLHATQPWTQNATKMRDWIFAQVAPQVRLDEKLVRAELPKLAERVRRRPDLPSYERASAAYFAKDYDEAERTALQAADEAFHATPVRIQEQIKAFKLAALAADRNQEYRRPLEHLTDAVRLCRQEERPIEWVGVQLERLFVLLNRSETQRAEEAEKIARTIIEVQTRLFGSEGIETLRTRRWLAASLARQSKYPEMELEQRDVARLQEKTLGPKHPETLATIWGLGFCLFVAGEEERSEAAFREAYILRKEVLGAEHPDTLRSQNSFASALNRKPDEALAEYRQLLSIEERVLGSDHQDTLRTLLNMGHVLSRDFGEYREAEEIMRELIARQTRAHGAEHCFTIGAKGSLANVFLNAGNYTEAERLGSETLKLWKKTVGPQDQRLTATRIWLALALDEQGKHLDAEMQLREALSAMQKQETPGKEAEFNARAILAKNLWYQGRHAEAEMELRTVIPLIEKTLGSKAYVASKNRALDAVWVGGPLVCRILLANSLRDQQKYIEAETEYRDVIRQQEKIIGLEDRNTLESYYNFAYQLAEQGKLTEAKMFALQAAQVAPKSFGLEHPYTRRYQALATLLERNQAVTLTDAQFRDSLAARSGSETAAR